MTSVTLAVNRPFRNQQGELGTDFVQCTLWKKVAENTVQYCRKGSLVGVTGRIHTRSYENQEGKRIYVTEVIAESVRFLETKRSGGSGSPYGKGRTTFCIDLKLRSTPMTTTRNNDQSLELLLENLIRMQGKLNEKVDHLHSRVNQLE